MLRVEFAGVLNDKLRGFYRSTFTDDDGARHTIAVTQFEATDARRAFPCWDEPAHKAVFARDPRGRRRPPRHLQRSRAARAGPLGDGRVRITFADTMPMSTYLVAFVVGPLEATPAVDVDGVPLRVVHQPGQGAPGRRSRSRSARSRSSYFADYYGIVYPGDKMDMVAVPDFAFGAMENLGCVIYRETLLLIDPATATQSELLAVVDVIAHELAHMWFGDLVTMSWWNGIWLNEAFATFMEMKCSDAFRPEWERWMHFGRERSAAFDTDALGSTRPIEFPVHSPDDAEGMFDVLTYQKGSAVVRMLEQYLGEDAFRDGIRRYLQTHQFANTETGDLWDALEAETGEPVRSVMDSWIFQGGFPLLTVRRVTDTAVQVEQRRFTYLDHTTDGDDDEPGRLWNVPIVVRSGRDRTSTVLDERARSVSAGAGSIMVNAGGHGFYRASYDPSLYAMLLDDLAELEPLERYSILDDALALCLRGDLEPNGLTNVIERLVTIGEDDLSIWQLGAEALNVLGRAVPDADRDTWSAWVCSTLRPLWESLGAEVAPDDSDRRRALRGLMLGLLGSEGDPEAVATADRLFRLAIDDPSAVEPGLASGALTTVARRADAATFDAMLDRFRNGSTVQEQLRFLYAAAGVEDLELFDRYLAMLATDEVRSQNLAFAHRAAMRNRRRGARAWAQVQQDWDRILARLPGNAAGRLVEGITSLDDPQVADEIVAFLDAHPVPKAAKPIAQHVERMQVSVALRERIGHRIVAGLT